MITDKNQQSRWNTGGLHWPASPSPSLCCWGWAATRSWRCCGHLCSGCHREWWSSGAGWSPGLGQRWPLEDNPLPSSLSGWQWWSCWLHLSPRLLGWRGKKEVKAPKSDGDQRWIQTFLNRNFPQMSNYQPQSNARNSTVTSISHLKPNNQFQG